MTSAVFAPITSGFLGFPGFPLLVGLALEPGVLTTFHLLVLDLLQDGDPFELLTGEQAPLDAIGFLQSLGYSVKKVWRLQRLFPFIMPSLK